MNAVKNLLSARLGLVEERLQSACARAGRPRDAVTLVAVTKRIASEVSGLLPDLGVHDLGENRPQELWRKAEALAGREVRWHLIGHLQRNKIERTLPLIHRLHSVDSVRLLQALETAERPLDVMLEFNCSGEASKSGFTPGDVEQLVPALLALKHLRLTGLMTMAAPEEDPEKCRPTFVLLRELRDRFRLLVPGHSWADLSMGMSNDFEVAIEEGATLVRLGSVLFEGVEP